jgi:hypothetical protein
MAGDRWEKLAAATGIAFPLLFVGAAFLIGGAGGDTVDPADVVAGRLEDNLVMLGVGTAVAALAAVALLWFSGSLRTALRVAEGGQGRLSAVAFGAGVIGAAMILVGALTAGSAGFELADYQGNAEGARAVYGISFVFPFFGVAISLGALLLATGLVSLRTGLFPAWLGWSGAVLGVIFLLGWWTWFIPSFGGILVLLWVIAISIVLIRMVGSPAPAG